MAIMLIYRVPGATPEHYDRVRSVERWDEAPQPGGIAHFISFDETGAVEVDVWESRQAFDDYWTHRHEPVLKSLGIEVGEPEVLELHNLAIGAEVAPYQLAAAVPRPKVTRVLESDALA